MSKRRWPMAVTPPPGGWKARTWYIVEASFAAANPIHRCLLFSGFLDNGLNPGGYSGLMPLNSAATDGSEPWQNAREVHFVRELCDVQGEPPWKPVERVRALPEADCEDEPPELRVGDLVEVQGEESRQLGRSVVRFTLDRLQSGQLILVPSTTVVASARYQRAWRQPLVTLRKGSVLQVEGSRYRVELGQTYQDKFFADTARLVPISEGENT